MNNVNPDKIQCCKAHIFGEHVKDGNKLIYEWVKAGYITKEEFDILIEFNYGME